MANAELNVILSADGRDLQRTLTQAEGSLTHFSQETKKMSGSFAKVDASLLRTTKNFQNASTQVRKSRIDFTNFSRVIQDLPFGFTAISNNLTQLIPGVGLLGVAFSGLVAALTFSEIGFSAWSRGAKGSGEAAKKAEKDLKEFEEAQKELKQTFDDAAKAVIGQTTQLQELGKALVDTTNKTLILTEATLKQGLAQFLFTKKEGLAQKIISDALENRLKVEQQLLKFRESEFKVTKKTSDLAPIRLVSPDELKKAGVGLNQTEQAVFDLNKLASDLGLNFDKFVESGKKKGGPDKFFDDLLKKVREWERFINDEGIRVANFQIIPDEPKEQTIQRAKEFIQNAINRRFEFEVNLKTLVIAPLGAELKATAKYFSDQKKNAEKIANDLQKEINQQIKRNPILIEASNIQAQQKAAGAEFFRSLGLTNDDNAPSDVLTKIQRDAVTTANLVNNTLTPAFQSFFDALIQGEDPIKSFFKGIGQAVVGLIQKLIQAAIQAALLKAVLSAFGLGGSVGSFGDVFKNLLGFRAEGGPVFANKPFIVGEKGPELFIPKSMGRIIPNHDLQGSMAGIQPGQMNVAGEFRIRGRDLSLLMGRQGGFENRNV